MKAREPIAHRESFISVPYRMLFTVDGAMRHEVLGPILAENPQLFSKGSWEHHVLVVRLIYDYFQGDQSFWKPWLDLMPDVKFFGHWPEDMIVATQDMDLIKLS